MPSQWLESHRSLVDEVNQTGFSEPFKDVLDRSDTEVTGLGRLRVSPAQHVGIASVCPGRGVPGWPQVHSATGEGLHQPLGISN